MLQVILDIGDFNQAANLVPACPFDQVLKLLSRRFRQGFDRRENLCAESLNAKTLKGPVIGLLHHIVENGGNPDSGECRVSIMRRGWRM